MDNFFEKQDYCQGPRVREGFLLLFMAFVTLGVYYPATLAPLSLVDDLGLAESVMNNPSWSYIFERFLHGGIYARPLPTATFHIIAKIFGLGGEPFHLFNVLVHLGNGVLIYFTIKKMYSEAASGVWLAFTVAMIFLVHPLNVESVAWVSCRCNLMATFFILLAFFLHLKVQTDVKDYRLWAAALCYLLSLLSYEIAAAMPLAFIFWDLHQETIGNYLQTIKIRYRRWLPYGLVFLAYFVYRLQLKSASQSLTATKTESTMFVKLLGLYEVFISHLSSPFVAVGFYLKKVFWPWPLNFYIVEVNRLPYFLFGVTFLLFMGWCIWKRNRIRFWGFWFVCGLLVILPLSVYSISWSPAAERYVYLSSIGFAAFVSLFVFQILASKSQKIVRTSKVLVLVLVIVFSAGTALRAQVWQSDLTLMEDTWRKNRANGRLADAYARTLWTAGRKSEAVSYLKMAIDLGYVSRPAEWLGKIEQQRENYPAAEKYYLLALWPIKELKQNGTSRITAIGLLHKRRPGIYIKLADLHVSMLGEEPQRSDYHKERIIHFHQAACDLAPDNVFYRYLLAKAYLRFGSIDEARKHFEYVQKKAPDKYYGKAAAKLAQVEEFTPGKKRVEFKELVREQLNNGQGG